MLRDFNGLLIAILDRSLTDEIASYHGDTVLASVEELDSLDEFIQTINSGVVDLILFTETDQIRCLLDGAAAGDFTAQFRDALRQIVIGVMDASCADFLCTQHLTPDFESDQPDRSRFTASIARLAHALVTKKRTAVDAGLETAYWQRIDMKWPHAFDQHNINTESMFLRACRGETTDYTPIWLNRQAGRYQRAYMNLKGEMDFLDMCKIPELTAEITLMAAERLDVDAAIIFADILPILQPLGFHLEYVKGTGPVIHNPIRSGEAVDQLEEVSIDSQQYVYEAIRMVRPALPPTIPLIGFSGAPFTLAAYAIEGGGSKHFQHVKTFMYNDPGAWHAFMEKLARAVTGYLNAQIEAGVQALQLFDSWVGCLSPDDYREFVLPHTGYIFAHLNPRVPTIHFGTGTGALLELMREAGGDVIGLDWRVDLAEAWHRLEYDVAVQGNLDPIILYSSTKNIRKHAEAILHKANGRPGHIFNLGHGILPGTPEDHVIALIDAVHELSTNQQFNH